MSSSYSEKRSERRFPINSVVNITLSNKRVIQGICCNISGSGMLIRAEKPVVVGSTVQLDIQEGRIDFKADAEVMRLEEENGQFLLGLKVSKKISV